MQHPVPVASTLGLAPDPRSPSVKVAECSAMLSSTRVMYRTVSSTPQELRRRGRVDDSLLGTGVALFDSPQFPETLAASHEHSRHR